MYTTHNESKSVFDERFVRALKPKIYKKITVNDSKSFLLYLNKLLYEDNNTYYRSIGKIHIDPDYCALTEEIESGHKDHQFTVGDRFRIHKYKHFFSKSYSKNLSNEIFVLDSVLKTYPWIHKIRHLNGETIIGSFYEKELLLSILQMRYYPEPDSHITDNVKVVLDLWNHATRKELIFAVGVDTYNLAAKSDFIVLKAKFDKLNIQIAHG